MTDSESTYIGSGKHAASLHLSAHSIGLSVTDRIQLGKIGKIHSTFQRVINIVTLKNRLISLVGQEVGQGPFNILVNIPTYMDLINVGVNKGDVVTRVGKLIVIGKNAIVLSTEWAELWKPRRIFQSSLQPIRIIMMNLEILREIALASDHLSGLGELISFINKPGLKVPKTKKLGPVAHIALPHIVSLLKAIKSGRSHDIIGITKHLVGLGPGLTPAADDMLLGLMISMFYIAENFPETRIDIKKINRDIVSSISGRTTTISEEFLREASIGNVNEPVASLMENLLTSENRNVAISAKNVLALGGTSGADTVCGIILGFQLLLSNSLIIREDFNQF